jgi:hypothetical protein
MFLDYCLNNVKFFRKEMNIIFGKISVAQVLCGNLTLQLHPYAPSHNNGIQR